MSNEKSSAMTVAKMEEVFQKSSPGDPQRKTIIHMIHKKHMNAMTLAENVKEQFRIIGQLIETLSGLIPYSPDGTEERKIITEMNDFLDTEIFRLRGKLMELRKKNPQNKNVAYL